MVHKLSGLLCHRHVLCTSRHKFNRLGCAEEYAHQAWLHGTYSISYLCGDYLASAILIAKINLTVIVSLRLNAVLADFALNKVHRVRDCVLHNAFDFAA